MFWQACATHLLVSIVAAVHAGSTSNGTHFAKIVLQNQLFIILLLF